ncbi:unnamed protein product [Linum trigynum]|uniref:ENTH domain-containing protein n=1 Tax=Linum trigynum TaxID=586398 RepID=A0AAV2C923_9ROSI
MGPSKLRRAVGAVKDQASISLAKVNNSSSLSDLEVAIVKATRHEEYPAEERHIREILSLTSYSHSYISACVSTLSRRLNKTKNWTVALKTLMLIQRLLNEGDPAYEQEIFFATRRGTRILNLSDFVDARSESWDYSAFVRTYALYLDEKLEFRMLGRRGKRSAFAMEDDEEEVEEEGSSHHRRRRGRGGSAGGSGGGGGGGVKATPLREAKNEKLFSRVQHLLHLLERFLACRPTGNARHDRVVQVALYPIVKESFNLYYDITDILAVLIDRFMDLDLPEAVKIYEIFCRVAKQFDELESFYSWCKNAAIARTSEYPEIERISHKKLELMDDFLRDKSVLSQTRRRADAESVEDNEEFKDAEEAGEEDMNAIKALPAPEESYAAPVVEEVKEEEEVKQEVAVQQEADLLNLGQDAMSSDDHANQLALALFDGAPPVAANSTSTPALTWEAFNDEADWETALVQSVSSLAVQRPALPGGFDMTLLDGMYQQGATTSAMSGVASYGTVSGSASSVALGSAGRPAMLALPAPPTSTMNTSGGFSDPFSASIAVPPPHYVQMSEMEKKQHLLMEEQLMWQQYAANGMQGHVGYGRVQHNTYNMGGYTHGY